MILHTAHMGVAKPITLDTRAFLKKGDAKAFFSAMLARYANGSRLNDEDTLDLSALLKLHPDHAEKVGPGVDHFLVNINNEHAQTTRSFWVVRVDGSIDDLSFHECITPRTK